MDDYAAELETALSGALRVIEHYGVPLTEAEAKLFAPWWTLTSNEKEQGTNA